MQPEPTDLVRSVSRALRVLEEVGRHPGGVSAKQVARRLDLHRSTAYHLLRTLAYEGYLARLPSGDFVPGLKLAERFADLSAALSAPPPADVVLRELAARTGSSAYMARFVDGAVAIIQVAEAPTPPRLEELIVGFSGAAHATALGKALLSTLPQAQRRGYLREQGMRPFTPGTVRDPEALDAELRAAGDVFVEEGQYRTSVSCAAVLAALPGGPAAVALAAPSDRLVRQRAGLVTALRAAAGDLQRAFTI